MEAVLESLQDTRVGCAAGSLARIVPPGEGEGSKGEEGGLGPP